MKRQLPQQLHRMDGVTVSELEETNNKGRRFRWFAITTDNMEVTVRVGQGPIEKRLKVFIDGREVR